MVQPPPSLRGLILEWGGQKQLHHKNGSVKWENSCRASGIRPDPQKALWMSQSSHYGHSPNSRRASFLLCVFSPCVQPGLHPKKHRPTKICKRMLIFVLFTVVKTKHKPGNKLSFAGQAWLNTFEPRNSMRFSHRKFGLDFCHIPRVKFL